jgi:hypothetical protein
VKVLRRSAIAAAVVCCSALSTLPDVSAGAASSGASARKETRAEIIADCKAVAAHDYTQAQLDVCKAHDWAARRTPDPHKDHDSGTLGKRALRAAVRKGLVSRDGDCPSGSDKELNGWVWTKKSLLGSTQYKWHFTMTYCRNGDTFNGRITKILDRSDWVSDTDFNVDTQEIFSDSTFVSDGQNNYGQAERERHLRLCLGGSWGCYAHLYPHATLTAHGWLDTFEYAGTAG